MLYAFFWVIPRRLNFICQHFGTLCLFHLHRQVVACRILHGQATQVGTSLLVLHDHEHTDTTGYRNVCSHLPVGTDFILLKAKRNLFYIRNQSEPLCKHFPPRL